MYLMILLGVLGYSCNDDDDSAYAANEVDPPTSTIIKIDGKQIAMSCFLS